MRRDLEQRGAAVVEFAVLILLLLVFLFGIIEFGIIWVQSYYIGNAAREGARVASKINDINEATEQDKVETAVRTYLQGIYGTLEDSEVNFRCCSLSLTTVPPNPRFVEIVVRAGTLNDFTDPDITDPPDARQVQVTVQTAEIWEPVLWELLKLIPGTDPPEIRQVTQSAVFTVAPG